MNQKMKKCVYLDELKSDRQKVCRLFIDWKEEYSGHCIVIDKSTKHKDKFCMCEMFQEDAET